MFSVTRIEDVEQNLAFLTAVWLPPRTGSCGVFKKEARKEFSNPVSKSECLNFGAWPRAERAGSSARFSVPHRLAVNNKIMVMGYQEGSPAKKKRGFVIRSRGRKSGELRKRTDVFGGGGKA